MLYFTLEDAKFEDKEKVMKWEYVQYEDFFVFYKSYDDEIGTGFKFMTLQIFGIVNDNPLFHPENLAEILYWGYAMFDGIRHFYLGSDKTKNYGYLNYPNIVNQINILKIIRELEIKYCHDHE